IQSHPEKIDENMVFKNMYKETVDIEDLSSGEKQILFRFFYLHSSGIKDSIVMVDEPENSLHPKWQQKIVNLYRRLGPKNQVIFATHSPHIISSLKPVNLFLLFHNKQENRIEVVNMEKARKQTRGLEPNRILQEIMGTPLRDVETQEQIDLLMEKIEKGDLESDETRELVETLKQNLGLKDPFIMRLEHRLRMLNFKKER
ncbi:MAG: ATP-binding protein, partial [Leptospiraceae bacterium]|nr:ATP-binding protein [Leptospiraceae bacterium]